jgi:hypothetical protein
MRYKQRGKTMNKVPSDIVLMTSNVTTLKETAHWTAQHCYHLIFINTGIPFFPFLDSKTQITFFEKRQQSLGSILNDVLDYVQGSWILLITEDSVDLLDHCLPLLERTVRTVPRLASLTPSHEYGLEQVTKNPLFGTLYSLWAIQNYGVFNPDLDTNESVEQDWSEKLTSKGWVHMRIHNQEDDVLPMEHFLPQAQAL